MSPELIDEACRGAMALPAGARERFLRDEKGLGDAEVREILELVSGAEALPAGFMEDGPAFEGGDGSGVVGVEEASLTGCAFGGYAVGERIGSGGFGVVYRAEQREPIRRPVALKVLRRGMDTGCVLRRFALERELLSRLRHPGVARIYDAGETPAYLGSRPFIAMELIEGVPIVEHCDRDGVGTAGRVELLARACEAVQHAHGRGVLHRDLKPSNIIVEGSEEGGGGVGRPRVIDFGIAKATAGPEALAVTETGQFVGTPRYMSPEQLAVIGGVVDARSDVYALGVVLYELLTGSTPFGTDGGERQSPLGVARAMESRSPEAPSVRLTRVGRASAVHRVGGASLRVRGELDWIVLRAIEIDPDRRYQTAEALAEDLRRYLRNEPVLARRPSRWYRLRKAASRNRLAAVAIAALVVTLPALTAWSVFAALEARAAQRIAEAEAAVSEATLAFVTEDLFGAADVTREGTHDATVREVVDAVAGTVDERFAAQPLVRAGIRRAVGGVYGSLSDYGAAQEHLGAALALQRATLGRGDVRTLRTQTALAEAVVWSDRPEPALALAREAHEGLRARLGDDDAYVLEAARTVGTALFVLDRFGEAIAMLAETEARQRAVLGAGDRATLKTADVLSAAYKAASDFESAAAVLDRAIPEGERALGADDAVVLGLLQRLAQVQGRMRDHAGREATLRRLIEGRSARYGSEHPQTQVAWLMLGQTYYITDRAVEAEPILRRVYAELERVLGATHRNTALARGSYARCLTELGRYDEALPLYHESLRVHVEDHGPDDPNTLLARLHLADSLRRSGALEEAERVSEVAVVEVQRVLGDGHIFYAWAMLQRAAVLRELGRGGEGLRLLEEAAAVAGALSLPREHDLIVGIERELERARD